MNFSFTLSDVGLGIYELKLEGDLNEDVNLGEIASQVHGITSTLQAVCIDLSQVRSINSCGVREWILFLEDLQSFTKLQFAKVGRIFIEQASMVPNVLGKAGTPVRVAELPYHCPSCDEDCSVFLEIAGIEPVENKVRLAPKNCERCKGALEFDAFEDDYFSFLRNLKKK